MLLIPSSRSTPLLGVTLSHSASHAASHAAALSHSASPPPIHPAQPQFLDGAAVRAHVDLYDRRMRPLDGRSALMLTRLASQTYHAGLDAAAPIEGGPSRELSGHRLPDWSPDASWPEPPRPLAVATFLEADLVLIVADRLEIPPARALSVLRELADQNCLRVDEAGHWRFESPLFHSYLTARWFSYAAEWDELMPRLTDLAWRPVWLMILALLPNADRLLRRMKTHLELLAHIPDEGSDLPLWYVAHQTLVSGLSVAQTVSPVLRSAINELLEG
jgi:hypothetical protein